MAKNIKLLFLVLTCICIVGCAKDMDDEIRPASSLEIKDFIWKGMNNIYLYKSDVPDLADDRFATQSELNEYLREFPSPEALFYEGLVAPQDEFSFLVSDYFELERELNGIGLTTGMEYGLVRLSRTSDAVFGYVRYIFPNTSADNKGLQRGDIFNRIDGEELTMDNYSRLINQSDFTIGLAELSGSTLTSLEEEVSLEGEQYNRNPIHIVKILETSVGKVGYLMYNEFTRPYDSELNATFAYFDSEGITDLILDLRYNGGGSVESSSDLASMVTGQFEGKIFAQQQWNENYEESPEDQVNLFNSTLYTGERINSLGLTKLYVLTTSSSASASELLINGLTPYINVVQIGENTYGKFQASRTLYDSPDFGREGANLGHSYAIQPLIYKSANAVGYTDFIDGLPPDIALDVDYENLGVLGETSDPFLQTALDAIEGNTMQQSFPLEREHEQRILIGESGMKSILYKEMYLTEEVPEILN